MRGNERVRFCDQCSMNVYNLSNMTKRDAESLVLGAEGRLCVRYYHRADGTILTGNCPVGLRALKRRVSGFSRAFVSSVLSFFAGMAVLAGVETTRNSLDAAKEASLDLISPVPLTNDEQQQPQETVAPEPAIAMGEMVIEPRTSWFKAHL
jgi:hypothetical protein